MVSGQMWPADSQLDNTNFNIMLVCAHYLRQSAFDHNISEVTLFLYSRDWLQLQGQICFIFYFK
jgi:hypothetical protein